MRRSVVGRWAGAFRAAAVMTLLLASSSWLSATPLGLAITNPGTKNWTLGPFGVLSLTAGAGSDLPGTQETVASFVTMDITVPGPKTWTVYVSRADTAWAAGLHLFVRLTGTSTGGGTIAGGTAYQEVTTSSVQFFYGDRNRSGMDIQLRLDGISVVLGPGTFSTTVAYTVTEP